MFLEELADLKDRYPARLALHHVLSREQRAAPLLSGRIDADKLATMLDVLVPPEQVTEWFLCGPFELVELCRETLAARGVPAERIRFELFTTDRELFDGDAGRPVIVRPDEETYRIDFTLDGLSSTRRDAGQRAASRSSTRRCACAPTCRSPAPEASAEPAAPASSTARCR